MELQLMNNEIITNKDLYDKIKSGINKVAKAVLVTMGPNGKTVIIANERGEPYVTKDGVSVAKYIVLKDPIENIAATLIKDVAKKTVEEAGDGTTTSICLAQAFINTGFDLLEQGVPYETIKKELNYLLEYTIKHLTENSKKITDDDIIYVANIACNNDIDIATIINNAFKHSKVVKVEETSQSEDCIETVTGMQLHTSYFDKSFINDGKTRSIKYDECSLIIIDGKLDSLKPISSLINQTQTVVIIAEHFSQSVISILKDNYNRGALNVALVKSPGFAQHRKDLLQDIADYTGGEVLVMSKTYNNGNVMGQLKSIHVTKEKTTILPKQDYPKCYNKIIELSDILKGNVEGYDKELLQQRLDNLLGKISIIKVGGKNEVEVKERFDRYEDAVKAVGCALEEGVVEGGGCALYKIVFDNLFQKCLGYPLQHILYNGADFKYLENVINYNIIDPTKVTRCALENAVSVAKTILSTEAIVLNESQWK